MKYFPIVFLTIMFISCSPRVHYFGDSHPSTQQVDSYYSPEDIKVSYKVMGQLQGFPSLGSNMSEKVKLKMIKDAKLKGADGILFLLNESYSAESSIYPIKADLLRYEK